MRSIQLISPYIRFSPSPVFGRGGRREGNFELTVPVHYRIYVETEDLSYSRLWLNIGQEVFTGGSIGVQIGVFSIFGAAVVMHPVKTVRMAAGVVRMWRGSLLVLIQREWPAHARDV